MSLRSWIRKFKYRYVGTIEGRCYIIRDDGTETGISKHCYWMLAENGFGRRKSIVSGRIPETPHANYAQSRVNAWLHGGALQQNGEDLRVTPREEPKAPKLNVVPLPSTPQGD